ncbi:hypothetical protein, partial [Buchananella hordeovulneris]|uniref:hypothetical protein n=1 Tax=Buchananella hordeovulneris TaxID=52770 RepID=UPI001C9E6BBB
ETVTDLEYTVAQIKALHEKHPTPEIATELAAAPVNPTLMQVTFGARAGIVSHIQVFSQESPIPNISTVLAMALFNLSVEQETVTDLEYTVAQIKALHEK